MATSQKFVVRGTLGTTPEIWSNSLHFKADSALPGDRTPADWDQSAVTNAVNAFYTSSLFSHAVKTVGWRGYHLNDQQHLIGNEMVRVDYGAPVASSAGAAIPPQVSLVLTLLADNRGLAKRGRIFLPMPTAQPDPDTFLITVGKAHEYLDAFKTYVEALKNAMFPALTINESMVNVGGKGSAMVIQDVTEYRCGRVLDTMRTRRNKLLEAYEVQAA
jgi:hypothetical protein